MSNRRASRARRALWSVVVAAVAVSGMAVGGAAPASAADPGGGVSGYVVGGQPIAEGQYPSLAAIMIDDPSLPARVRLLCTGTVVHPRWVMTAGHCSDAVLFGEKLVAQIGRRDLGSPKAQTLKVNRAVVHKTYFNKGTGYDVALFHTMGVIAAPVSRLAATVADDALAAGGKTVTVVGWGLTRQLGIVEPPAWRAKPPRRANGVDIPVVDDGTCASTYADYTPGFFLPASDMCAGTAGKNVCYGDSGGPLYARDPAGQLVQVGITSRGAGCATKLFPAIFTEVRKVHAWVAKWTTTRCENKFEFPSLPDDPDFPDFPPLPSGVLYIC